ncbi:hypothetical protein Leryth_025532 [Lithospermum erythrorhizon]|nr:hypothetical protein Leryth_025532 [Lithospermum erythrorhizon]
MGASMKLNQHGQFRHPKSARRLQIPVVRCTCVPAFEPSFIFGALPSGLMF